MSAQDLILVVAWGLLGVGGGWIAGVAVARHEWLTAAVAGVGMCVGIACGIAVWS